MPRKLQPYGVTAHAEPQGTRLPMDTPTMATRRTLGDNPALGGLVFKGGYSQWVPINDPIPGQSVNYPAFPLVQPSQVAPNAIRVNIVAALNRFSPNRHSNPLTTFEPPKATVPPRKIPRAAKGRRGTGGHFTIPAPLSNPSWPTSSDWLARRMARSLPTAQAPNDWPYTKR